MTKTFNVTESELAELAQTKMGADSLLWQLQEIQDKNFSTNQLTDFFKSNLHYDINEKIQSLLMKNQITFEHTSDVYDFLSFISDKLKKMPLLELTLANSPSEKQIDGISSQLLQAYKKAFLIALTIDPAIIGGAIVCFNGRMKDYSIQKMFSTL